MREKITTGLKSHCNRNNFLFALAVGFIILIHETAFHDRMVLILLYLVSVGSAYSLVRRRCLGLASAIVAITAATIFAQVYYSAKPDHWHPLIDPIRDMLGLGALLFMTVHTMMKTYSLERDERQRQVRKLMEEKLVAMRAEALRRTSHEVRTPLSTITAISETMLDGSTGQLTADQREFIKDIDDAAKHLLALVNDILDFAKAEAGMIRLSPEPVVISELIEQCVKMIEIKANERQVTLSAQVAHEVNIITADPLRLRQIILNLLSNAVKFTEPGGSVVLRVRSKDKHTIRISVRDTGRGIPAEHIPHLFQPYYQAAVTDQGIGTGLGLAIIKHLTELHGGKVTVESVVGAGTVFTIDLPLESASTDASPVVSEPCESSFETNELLPI